MTSWSGGENWIDEEIITNLRQWVYEGGGFIGVGEPTAYQKQGKLFQLFDVLGVDRDLTYGLSYRKYHDADSSHIRLRQRLPYFLPAHRKTMPALP